MQFCRLDFEVVDARPTLSVDANSNRAKNSVDLHECIVEQRFRSAAGRLFMDRRFLWI